jgi:hypothetical protein
VDVLGNPVVTLEEWLMVSACDVGLYSTTWLDACRMGCHSGSETGTRATTDEEGDEDRLMLVEEK